MKVLQNTIKSIGLSLLIGMISLLVWDTSGYAQVVISPTPVRVEISTSTALPTSGIAATPIPPTFTPTNQGPPQLEAAPGTDGVNVRAEPDINSDRLGVIRQGEFYPITGRYFRWLQFRFDPSPTGLAYVYDELIIISGDPAAIPDLTESLLPTQDTSVIDATSTANVLLQTPGAEVTLTASARIIEAPSGVPSSGQSSLSGNSEVTLEILPTYTYPPNMVAIASTMGAILPTPTSQPGRISINASRGVAPIVPIVLLGGFGILGLLISTIRMRR